MRTVRNIALFLLVALLFFGAVLFAIKNSAPVRLSFFSLQTGSWQPSAEHPLYLVLILTFLAGAALTACFFLGDVIRLRWRLRRFRRQNQRLQHRAETPPSAGLTIREQRPPETPATSPGESKD